MATAAELSPPARVNPALPGVARVLLNAGKIDDKTADEAYRKALGARRSFIEELVLSKKLSAAEIAATLADTLAAPLVDVAVLDLQRLPQDVLDPKLAAQYRVLPLGRRGGRLVVVTANPADHETAEKLKFITQSNVEWVVGEFDKLLAAIETLNKSVGASLDEIANEDFDFGETSFEDPNAIEGAADADVEDAPVVRFLHKMLIDAINLGASDLHFEPYEHIYRVRFRIDGQLQEISSPPAIIKEKLASRIKILARLDISEKRVPQDGRMKLRISAEHAIDFRVSTLPTLFGEKIVIRILDPNSAKVGIDALGYEDEEKERLLRAVARPYGMVLVTGPTGSGKTVSLYTCLNLLNKPGTNISTAEDPSEIYMQGVNQVNVNDRVGLNFAVALRAFLRQDPDVIMVGEIRDLETADIAVKAAQTGHLVLSTLHTNDAPGTLTRLRNMGVAPFNIASSVILITAQRLARKLCPKCKKPEQIPEQVLLDAGFQREELDGSWTAYQPVGCDACNNGYKGRTGVYQVMPISDELRRIILADGSATELAQQARAEGIRTMRESGLIKVKKGITSLEEILAITDQ